MSEESTVRRTIARRAGRVARAASVFGVLAFGALGLGASAVPALAGECPNEQVRAENNSLGLPECRAYELVSPSFKEGFAPLPRGYTDDGAFSFRSTGDFAENNLGSPSNQYLATRSVSGWHTISLAPSGLTYANVSSTAEPVSADLRSSVWAGSRRADQGATVSDLYLRSPDGIFTRIGPGANPTTVPLGVPGTVFLGATAYPAQGSADLSHVLYTVFSQNGYPGDTSNGISSLYEYVGTGNERPELVDVDNAGNQISRTETCPNAISADGRVVVFTPDCAGRGSPQVWASIDGNARVQVSASECTRTAGDPGGLCNASAPAKYAASTADGSRVYFTTTQQLVNGDTDQTSDLYACGIPPGNPAPAGLANPCASLTEVSGAATGAEVENVVNVSEDGSRVYFVAKGVLADNIGTNDATAAAGDNNLYVAQLDAAHPSGQTTFVAQLTSDDIEGAQSTSDGRYLVFTTANQMLLSDTDEAQDVYRYDADSHALRRLSTDTSGSGGNEPGFDATTRGVEPFDGDRQRSVITSDGDTVVFRTSEALSPTDTDGTIDVYAWRDGQVSLISSGRPSPLKPGASAEFAWITSSGSDIFFPSTAQLTGNDVDTSIDVYDARVGGGFSLAQPQACSGEACAQALVPAPQALPAPASAAFSGTGNLTALVTTPASKPTSKPLTRAQKLAKAQKACRSKHNRKKRSLCERNARAIYRKGKR